MLDGIDQLVDCVFDGIATDAAESGFDAAKNEVEELFGYFAWVVDVMLRVHRSYQFRADLCDVLCSR